MYIIVEELDTLMPSIFLSSELSSAGWDNCTTEDKQVLITRSVTFLNNLYYQVGKTGTEEFNDSIKKAQVCVIYDLLFNSNSSRYGLRKQRVKTINAGGVSESYTDEEVTAVSDRYKQYIGKYLFKGVIRRYL